MAVKYLINKGEKVLCIKSVYMKPGGRLAYRQGEVYTSEKSGCITDLDKDENHVWRDRLDFDKYFVFVEETCLYDNYGKRLQVGQTVAVAVTQSIVVKGKIIEIGQSDNHVRVEITWPAGNTSPQILTSYSRQEYNQICMSQIMVLDTDD